MSYEIETIEYRNHKISTYYDEFSDSPRVDDNIGTIVAFHSRYNLSDVEMTIEDAKQLYKDTNLIVYPIYMYEHSGIILGLNGNEYPFNDRWDSGQIGFIYCTKEKALKEFGNAKKVTKKVREYIYNHFVQELETYSDYLNGNVYGYKIEGDLCEDSCAGYIGNDGLKYAIECAKQSIDCAITYETEEDKNSEAIMYI